MADHLANVTAYNKHNQLIDHYNRLIAMENNIAMIRELIKLVHKHQLMAEELRRRMKL